MHLDVRLVVLVPTAHHAAVPPGGGPGITVAVEDLTAMPAEIRALSSVARTSSWYSAPPAGQPDPRLPRVRPAVIPEQVTDPVRRLRVRLTRQ